MRLLLDENVSPRLVLALLGDGHDVVHVRDRGWSGLPDHVLWREAVNDDRAFVTINVRDFRRLATAEDIHGGLITFPSGASSDGQLQFIRRGIDALVAAGEINTWVRVEDDREIVAPLPELQ